MRWTAGKNGNSEEQRTTWRSDARRAGQNGVVRGPVDAERFLAQKMLARGDDGAVELLVQIVRHRAVDGLHTGVGQELAVVGRRLPDRRDPLGQPSPPLIVPVADRDQLGARVHLRQVKPAGHGARQLPSHQAAADDPERNGCHVGSGSVMFAGAFGRRLPIETQPGPADLFQAPVLGLRQQPPDEGRAGDTDAHEDQERAARVAEGGLEPVEDHREHVHGDVGRQEHQSHGERHGLAADPVGIKLRQHHPAQGRQGQREGARRHEHRRQRQRRGQPEGEVEEHQHVADGHRQGARDQDRPPPELLGQPEGDDRAERDPGRDDDAVEDGVRGVRQARLHEQRGGVEKDHVHAVDLGEDHQDDADAHRPADAAPPELAEPAGLFAELGQDILELPLRLRPAVDAGQDAQGLGRPAGGRQPARALRHQEQPEGQDQRRDALGGEHPAPVPAERKKIGHDDRQRQADDDGQLVDDHQPPAQPGGRHLGDVHGGDRRSQPHAHAADKARGRELPHARRQGAARGRDQKQQGRKDQGPAPPELVRQRNARQRTERAAEDGAPRDRSHPERRQAPLGLEEDDRAGDQRQVVAEQESADGGDEGDEVKVPGAARPLIGGRVGSARASGSVPAPTSPVPDQCLS